MLRPWLRWRVTAPVAYVPSAVDLAPFRAARREERAGNVWLGRLERGKGLDAALRWAEERGEALDVYGFGSLATQLDGQPWYRGALEHERVAEVLGTARRFVHLPTAPDACPRTVIEAWAAGCELVVNRNVGTLWWLEHEPEALENAAERFWEVVTRYGP
jgi:glycosyltransferase involved in cell wall biosynthesis